MKEETRINEELKIGFILYHEGHLEEAWGCFQVILKEHPENEEARKAIELIEAHPKYKEAEIIREERDKERIREVRGERKRERIRETANNPAIPWMILGFILAIVGLLLVLGASASTPQPPTGDGYVSSEDWENYADEVQAHGNVICGAGMIQLIGFLIFMISTIWGVSWNAKK